MMTELTISIGTRKEKERRLTGRQRGTGGMMHISIGCNLSATKSDRLHELRWMPRKVSRGVKVEDMHAMVDGVCTNEVVIELIDINCRHYKSWEVLNRCVAQGRSNRGD